MSGRPCVLDDTLMDQICECLELGLSNKSAYELVGISHESFYSWIRRGDAYKKHLESGGEAVEKEQIFLEFSERITRARRKCEATLAQQIREAVPKDWKAGAWLLERAFHENWSKKNEVDITTGGEPVKFSISMTGGIDIDDEGAVE